MGDNAQPTAAAKYEVRMTEGQKFRELDKNKELDEPPVPPIMQFLIPGGEWSSLPLLVGVDYYLDIHQAPDIVKDNVRFHVFHYWGTAESGVCQFRTYLAISIFNHVDKVNCDGEVWTDADMHILRMSKTTTWADDGSGCMLS